MPRCEMCGTTEDELQKVTVEQATLEVCSNCEKYGATVDTETDSTAEPSTNDSPDTETQSPSSQEDELWEENELRSDYGEALEQAREENGLSLTEAANEMNIKKSHLRKVESMDRLPSREMQNKLEQFYRINLSGQDGESLDYGDTESGGVRLGEIAEIN